MNRIKINEAIEAYQDRTGKRMTKKDLAALVFPELKPEQRELNLRRLARGNVQRVTATTVRRICEATGVDANFLFNINQ